MSASCPAGELVSVSLNEVVRLQCPATSQLSQQHWERPNSRLSSDLYLYLDDGSLSFVATPATLGHYLCCSTENGFQQTPIIYHVKQKSSPTSPTSNTRPQVRPVPTTPAPVEPLQSAHVPSYLKELVVVSVLLVLCLSLLITILLHMIKHRRPRQTAPQPVTPTGDSNRRTPVEPLALRANQWLNKHIAQSAHSGQASELGRNSAITGSNGNLPNTPS